MLLMTAASSLSLAPFDRLYAAHRPVVYRAAFKVLQNAYEAEDVVQIIFLKAWLQPSKFRGGNLESWLTTLARNSAIDILRRRRREHLRETVDRVDGTSETEDVETLVLRRLRYDGVREAVFDLREEQRHLVLAAFRDGITHQELARTTRLPLGTVKTRIRSGLAHLRKAVGPEI